MTIPISDDHTDAPALTLANYIFGGGMSSRLFQRIRTKEGLSYGVGSRLTPMPKMDWSEFEVYAISAPQNSAKVQSVFQQEIEKARTTGFSDAELNEARKGYLQSRTLRRSQDSSLAMSLVQLDHLNRTMAWESEFDKKLAGLTLDQVNAAFKKYIDPSRISYVKAGDFSKVPAAIPAAAGQ